MKKPWPLWPAWLLVCVLLVSAGVIAWFKFGQETPYEAALKTGQVTEELKPLTIVIPQGVKYKALKHSYFIRDKDQTGAKPGQVKGKEVEFTRLYIECEEPVIVFIKNPTETEVTLTLIEQIPQPVKELAGKEKEAWEAAKAKWDKQEALRVAFRKAFRGIDEMPLPYPTYMNLQAVLQSEQGDVTVPAGKVGMLELKRNDPDSYKQMVLKLARSEQP